MKKNKRGPFYETPGTNTTTTTVCLSGSLLIHHYFGYKYYCNQYYYNYYYLLCVVQVPRSCLCTRKCCVKCAMSTANRKNWTVERLDYVVLNSTDDLSATHWTPQSVLLSLLLLLVLFIACWPPPWPGAQHGPSRGLLSPKTTMISTRLDDNREDY